MSTAFSNRPGAALEEHASQALAQLTLDSPLGQLPRRALVGVSADTPLATALGTMQAEHIGSLLVLDAVGKALGILTRHDILGRVSLPQRPLTTPISEVMSKPVHTLTVNDTAHDAALLMARRGIRHVAVTDAGGRVVSMVSERDLFAMQRLSLRQVSATIRGAQDVPTLAHAARDIRRLARELLCQGVGSLQLTQFISYLNDVLSERLVQMLADEHGLDLQQACWLTFGSEGRSEQTISTDQDNGLVFVSDDPEGDRPRWLAFGRRVNEALDACGYPLCRGGIMAGEPQCCLTLREWRERFADWIDHGAPQDLLNASIYFDLRGLAGYTELAQHLHAEVLEAARRTPRFLKQMAQNALSRAAPLNWLGGIDVDERGTVDLKLQGTAIFVDAARLYSLAHGSPATSTRERLESAGSLMGLAPSEYEAWVGGFEFMQMLRLQVQLQAPVPLEEPNRIEVATLNDIDRRILKESFRVARSLQQRMHLDYER